DIVVEFCGPSRWKELNKESGRIKIMKARSFLIFTIKVKSVHKFKESLRCLFGSSDRSLWNEHPFCTNRHVVPYGELDGSHVALVARFGVVSKSANRILVSHGG
nr:hypothetical protein [Tanacetum cinerariifolium]